MKVKTLLKKKRLKVKIFDQKVEINCKFYNFQSIAPTAHARILCVFQNTRLSGTCKAGTALPLDLSKEINIEFLFK